MLASEDVDKMRLMPTIRMLRLARIGRAARWMLYWESSTSEESQKEDSGG